MVQQVTNNFTTRDIMSNGKFNRNGWTSPRTDLTFNPSATPETPPTAENSDGPQMLHGNNIARWHLTGFRDRHHPTFTHLTRYFTSLHPTSRQLSKNFENGKGKPTQLGTRPTVRPSRTLTGPRNSSNFNARRGTPSLYLTNRQTLQQRINSWLQDRLRVLNRLPKLFPVLTHKLTSSNIGFRNRTGCIRDGNTNRIDFTTHPTWQSRVRIRHVIAPFAQPTLFRRTVKVT